MPDSTGWKFYDPGVETYESHRKLPHKDQSGTLTFVTFRLADSMPRHIVIKWRREIEHWLCTNASGDQSVEQVLSSSTVDMRLKSGLKKFMQQNWHHHLDCCHGQCVLKNSQCRQEVKNSLLHFNENRYNIERFVIMPNHVHVLIQMRPGFFLRKQFCEIQRFSARRINKILARSGGLWQGEPFDHIVRNENQFEYLKEYIDQNPQKAQVPVGEYTFWQSN